jgi:hypothetical protein
MGILADLSGAPREPLPPVADRKFGEIDNDNFFECLRVHSPRVARRVPDVRMEEGALTDDLTFESMSDFLPDAVTDKVLGAHVSSLPQEQVTELDSDGPGARIVCRYKKLLIYYADLTDTPWFRREELAPLPPIPEDIEVRWLQQQDWEQDPGLLGTPADIVQSRFSDGSCCLIMRNRSSGKTVYHVWLGEKGAYNAWIYKYLHAPPNGVLVFDAWVDPGYRGRNVHKLAAALVVREAITRQRPLIMAGVEEHEFFPFAMMYAKAGLGVCVPQHHLYLLRLPGVLKIHWRGGASPRTLEFADKLRRRYSS